MRDGASGKPSNQSEVPMHRWPILTGALLCSSCLAYDAHADAVPGGPAIVSSSGAEDVGTDVSALLNDPCNRACAAAAYMGCGYVMQQCADAGSTRATVTLDACALPCDAALPAGCGGMVGLDICVSDCSR
jgi:hypothetical protein